MEVRDNRVNIYTTIAQHPDEIDIDRARQEKEDAEAALREEIESSQLQSTLLQIRRALVRLEVAVHSSDRGYFDDKDKDYDEIEDDE